MNFGEHAAHPRNMKALECPTGVGRAQVEGDTVSLSIAIKAIDGVIVETSFESFLCGFAIGVCSVLTERIKGMTLGDAESVTAKDLVELCEGLPEGRRHYANTATAALRAALNHDASNPPN